MKIILIDMKASDIKVLKQIMYDLNAGICPLLGIEVEFDSTVVDHEHKLKSEIPSIDGKGLVRNALEFRANALEGKITNNWKRYFGADVSKHPCSLSTYLRNLADYLEQGPFQLDEKMFVHPSETIKEPKLKKSSYNKLKKIFLKQYLGSTPPKFPNYPASKKLTNPLKKWYEKLGLEPEFHKR